MQTVIKVTKIYANGEELFFNSEYEKENKYSCQFMRYHEPQGEGDAHYVDVFHWDGKVTRVFRPDEVVFKSEGNK